MKNRFVKFAAAVAPAALLLASGATPADAKVLLLGDGGWEVSFDGSVNGFAVWHDDDNLSGGTPGLGHSIGLGSPGAQTSADESFRVRTGLLPAVWGMNVKAPTTGGLDMAARIGLYPNISDNTKNGEHNKADLDLREIFFTVDGSFGQVLVGKTLSQFMGKNILTDMTLFGVGGIGIVGGSGGTTLGRIGYGYPYPQFNARIQYTTPDMNGFKVSVGIYDPARIQGNSANGANNLGVGGTTVPLSATETDTPKFEGEASYAGNVGGVDLMGWINGMYESATYTVNSNAVPTATCATLRASGIDCNTVGDDVNSWGFGGGLQGGIPLGPGTLTLMGSGYVGQALGLTFMQDVALAGGAVSFLADATDGVGVARDHWGYIGQGTYAFGQGTSVGVSYGESRAEETDYDKCSRLGTCPVGGGTPNAEIESQSLIDAMLWHDINPNLRLVAEYGRQQVSWFDGADQDTDIFSLGAFFFW